MEMKHAVKILEIPEDLIEIILLRLPVKSLLRFRCVSKSWCYLIKSYRFAQSQLNFAVPNDTDSARLILDNTIGTLCGGDARLRWSRFCKQYYLNALLKKSDDLYFPTILSSQTNFQHANFIYSCNGLCCVSMESRIFIWNPSTRVYRELPSIDGFDQSVATTTRDIGFGFEGDDYKVLCQNKYYQRSSGATKLYSLRNNSWKRVDNFIYQTLELWGRGTFVNKKLYWLTHEKIVYFDLKSEASGTGERPIKPEDCNLQRFSVLREWLCLSCTDITESITDIWILKQCELKGECWNKMISIYHHTPCPGISGYIWPKPVWMTREGKIWILLTRSAATYLLIYDPRSKSFEECSSIGEFHVMSTSIYVPSLVSPFLDG